MAEFRLETPRLILRDWRDEDWAPFLDGTNTPEGMRWLGGVMDAAKQQWQRERLLGYARDHGHTFWVVERRDAPGVVGLVGLLNIPWTAWFTPAVEIGWRIAAGPGRARFCVLNRIPPGFLRS